MDQTVYAKRRKQLLAALEPASIAILPTAQLQTRNGDVTYPFRANSDFYYLTGLAEPSAIAVFIPGGEEGEYILFTLPKDPKQEQWSGPRVGQQGAVDVYQADRAHSIDEFASCLAKWLPGKQYLYYPIGAFEALDSVVKNTRHQLQTKVRSGQSAPDTLKDVRALLHSMRLIKGPEEVGALRQAIDVSCCAHRDAMQMCKPGLWEYEIEAELLRTCCSAGLRFMAYEPIVASGSHACVLHYTANNAKLCDKNLLLVDAGAECDGYAADITRTYPINGRFSGEQAALYEIVLRAQLSAIQMIKPGTNIDTLEQVANRVITEGLIDVGILKGTLDGLLEQKAYSEFYMHRLGHWLGLDVHDVGHYREQGQWCSLQPGMVRTVEPGIYISPGILTADERWWGIGIRIEDDILITAGGCEVLSQALPKDKGDIEHLMQRSGPV